MNDVLGVFKALADEVRLRILHVVGIAELSVAEMVEVLELPQSTVSRHLKALRDNGLVDFRRDGTYVYYHTGPALSDTAFAAVMKSQLNQLDLAERDRHGVDQALKRRKKKSREFFDKVAGTYSQLTEPGGGWQVLAAGLCAGFNGRVIADIGSGEGQLSLSLAAFAKKVYAIDHSSQMIRVVREQARLKGLADRLEGVEGDMEDIPLASEVVDAAFLSQCLHHANLPERAVAEAARIIKPGGMLIIMDLVSHQHEWVREELADQWLGFGEDEIRKWSMQASVEPVYFSRREGAMPHLHTLIYAGTKQ